MTDRLRSLLSVQVPGITARVDILRGGQVRLQIVEGGDELQAATLEDLLLDAAAWPPLSAAAYEQLAWELDLLALRGDE